MKVPGTLGPATVLLCAVLTVALPAPASARPDAAPVPGTFLAQSITWISARNGWVLGTVPCGGRVCTEVIGTSNGSSWAELGRVPAVIAHSGEPGISEIRMGTARDGWVFGPGLFHTTNGGRTWRAEVIPGRGKQLLDLAATSRLAYAIVSPCAPSASCTRRLTVWRTTNLASPAWRRVPLTLPANTTFSEFPAVVAISHQTVYLADSQLFPTPDAFYASVNGGTFEPRPVPCLKSQDGNLADVAPISASKVALLCVIGPGMGTAEKTAWRSDNTGRTDHFAGKLPILGLTGLLAATASGTLAAASYGARGSFVYLNSAGTKWTTPLPKNEDGGAGWNDITFSSATTGWVVYGPDDFSDLGIVYRTTDGGKIWKQYSFSPPANR